MVRVMENRKFKLMIAAIFFVISLTLVIKQSTFNGISLKSLFLSMFNSL